MKKRVWLTVLTLVVLTFGCVMSVHAEVIPPRGEGQIGLQAVVLSQSVTVREEPRTNAKAVKKLKYGDTIIVQKQKGGWAECFLSDDEGAGPAGWVNTDYIAIDPAYYRLDVSTPVYAWNSTKAPKVALLTAGTTLPILKDTGSWLVVSLRGASGWIRK